MRRDYRRMATVGGVFALALVNLWALGSTVYYVIGLGGGRTDWDILARAAELIAVGLDPYSPMPGAPHLAFRWSPLMAWAIVPIAALGFWPWVAAHLVALAGFGSWRIAAVALVSWPFALDVVDGGAMVFVVLAAWWAYRGSTMGTAVFLALGVLIPRPLHLPLMGWIMWRRPEWRIPFAVLFLAHAGAVVAMGWHVEWAARLLASGWDVQNVLNLGPSRIIGTLWVPVGIALGVWLTARGRLGLASLAFSPYILPQYLLWLVLEVRPSRGGRSPGESGST